MDPIGSVDAYEHGSLAKQAQSAECERSEPLYVARA
jgi:hypothetical protein